MNKTTYTFQIEEFKAIEQLPSGFATSMFNSTLKHGLKVNKFLIKNSNTTKKSASINKELNRGKCLH